MECSEVRKLLPEMSSDSLSKDMQKEVEAHCEACEACRKEARAYEKVWEALGSWTDIEPEPLYKARFWEKAAKNEGLCWILELFSKKMFVMAGSICVLAAVLIALVLVVPSGDLFNEPYLAWQGVDMKRLSEFAAAYGPGDDEIMVAFDPGMDIFTLPEYVEENDEIERVLSGLQIGEKKIRIMEGAYEAIVDLSSP